MKTDFVREAEKKSHWERFLENCPAGDFQRLWRTHNDAVNRELLNRWWPEERLKCILKTDLFDEAVNGGLTPFLTHRADKVFCVDISFGVHLMAKRRYPGLQTVSADVRRLPFAEGAFDGIVSNSTLDHFESADDLSVALRELHRVLRPGGQLILTLDNPANPAVFLRNRLPYRLLRRINIVPYYVGRTLRARKISRLLEELGFHLLEMNAILHSPRILAIILAHWMEKHASLEMRRKFLSFLMSFERLSKMPTRFFTGYFVAVRCIRS